MKKPFPVPDSIRANVKEDLSPMLGEIKDPQMRDYVVEAWAASLFLNGFTAVHELQGSGALDVLVQKNASQAAHLCGTAKMSKGIGEALLAMYPALPIDIDLLVAGGLLHDVGKPPEYNKDNRRRWMEKPYLVGNPPVSHALYGYYICMALELPLELACIPGVHCTEGELHGIQRSIAATIVHYADWMYWDCMKVLGELDASFPYADVILAPYQNKTNYEENFLKGIRLPE